MHYRVFTASKIALIRISVVLNYSQRLTWPILWIVSVSITYIKDTALLPVQGHITHLGCPPSPTTHPTLPHSFICATCDITVSVKELLNIQQYLLSSRYGHKIVAKGLYS